MAGSDGSIPFVEKEKLKYWANMLVEEGVNPDKEVIINRLADLVTKRLVDKLKEGTYDKKVIDFLESININPETARMLNKVHIRKDVYPIIKSVMEEADRSTNFVGRIQGYMQRSMRKRKRELKKGTQKREVKKENRGTKQLRQQGQEKQIKLTKEERKNIRKWEKLLAKETPKSYEFLEKLEKAMKKNNPVKAMKAEIEKHERLENQIWEEIKEDKEARSALVRYGKERLGKSLKDMQKNPWMINEKVLRKYHPKVADKIKAIKDSIEQRKKLESAANEQKLALETLKRVISKHKSLAKQTYNQRVKIIKKFMNKKIKRAR